MAQDRRKRPRDFSQAAKLVIDIATGQVEDRPPTTQNPGFVTSGDGHGGTLVSEAAQASSQHPLPTHPGHLIGSERGRDSCAQADRLWGDAADGCSMR
jgi:hypothetical protein